MLEASPQSLVLRLLRQPSRITCFFMCQCELSTRPRQIVPVNVATSKKYRLDGDASTGQSGTLRVERR
jgi:hypothetical protein